MSHVRFDPRRAFDAARKLASNPDDLPQVFTIIDSLSMRTLERMGARMKKSDAGRRLLASRPDIVELLADREALAKLPEGSLGRAYLAFVEREGISAAGILEAAKKGTTNKPAPEPLAWIHSRMRDTHDLWHAAVGYSGDVLGETALLAFTFIQTWNPAIALILGIGIAKTLGAQNGAAARKTITDGFRRGWKAQWLPDMEWESLLSLPVTEVRRLLSLDAPPVYREIRSSEIREKEAEKRARKQARSQELQAS